MNKKHSIAIASGIALATAGIVGMKMSVNKQDIARRQLECRIMVTNTSAARLRVIFHINQSNTFERVRAILATNISYCTSGPQLDEFEHHFRADVRERSKREAANKSP